MAALTRRRPAIAMALFAVVAGCGTIDDLAWKGSRGAIHGTYDTLVDPNDRVHQALADPHSSVRQELRRFLHDSVADTIAGLEDAQLQRRIEALLQALLLSARRDGSPAIAG